MADSSIGVSGAGFVPSNYGLYSPAFTVPANNTTQYTASDLNTAHMQLFLQGQLPGMTAFQVGAGQNMYATIPFIAGQPHTFLAAISTPAMLGVGAMTGIAVRESATGKAILWVRRNDGGVIYLERIHMTNDTTIASVVEQFQDTGGPLLWLQMAQSVSNWRGSASHDGLGFSLFGTETPNSFCTPDQIGYVSSASNTMANCPIIFLSQSYK